MAAERGLRLPFVYNSGGYDAVHTLRLLDGVVDIYMPDMKYSDEAVGERLSGVGDYVARNRAALLEMHRQVGDLELDERGVASRGLLVRHLVLPGGLAGSAATARFLADEVSRDTYINVMDQYRPAFKATRGELGCGGTAAPSSRVRRAKPGAPPPPTAPPSAALLARQNIRRHLQRSGQRGCGGWTAVSAAPLAVTSRRPRRRAGRG